MSNPLPNLFDKSFIIGYFLPVLVFFVASLGLTAGLDQTSAILPWLPERITFLTAVTLIILASALGGVVLAALNRSIIRLMEGYGPYNPTKLWAGIERRRFRQISNRISELRAERDFLVTRNQHLPNDLRKERIDLALIKAQRFPDVEGDLLPTAFGNTIRAFEVYPLVIYGINAVQGWGRLLAVMPKEYLEVVDAAKAQMDFWVNLWLLNILFILETVSFAVYLGRWDILWFPLLALGVAMFASSSARGAAADWGNAVKAAFDVFLPQLRAKLEFKLPADMKEERKQWSQFSMAFLYRDQAVMLHRDQLQQPANDTTPQLLDQLRQDVDGVFQLDEAVLRLSRKDD